MSYEIKTFDDPVLKQVCDPVEHGVDISEIVEAMRRVCWTLNGAGLAAPQIGVTKRIILVEQSIMINPKITWSSARTDTAQEGCLSYPGIRKDVERPLTVKVTGFSEEWKKFTDEIYTKLPGRILQHEVDHLNGICRVGDET